jgi:dTDP-glucose pyrophosphorylase/CBS domain-containing protein
MKRELDDFLVSADTSVRDAAEKLDRNGMGIVLGVDGERRLLFTVTDGDLRRAVLAGLDLGETVERLAAVAKLEGFAEPLTASSGTPPDELLRLMVESTLRQIPLLDEAGQVVDIALLDDLAKDYELPLRAVVMAGGRGERLHPLTEGTPKPMLLVGDRPLLELIVERLRGAGIRRVSLATHYHADQISEHFGTGDEFGVDIHYVEEERPLGTAGALGLLAESDEPLLVVNGDILTRVDFRAFLQFHREHEADMTVAVREHELAFPFGVVQTDGTLVRGIEEKPILRQLVNAGIYLLEPKVQKLVRAGEPHDMVDLIERLVAGGGRVVAFPIREYWLDVGGVESYERAQQDVDR